MILFTWQGGMASITREHCKTLKSEEIKKRESEIPSNAYAPS